MNSRTEPRVSYKLQIKAVCATQIKYRLTTIYVRYQGN